MLTILDEYTRECLAMDVSRRMSHRDVMDRLAELFINRGVPECLRSDNGSEFTAQAIRDWLKAIGVRTLYIEPGSPWENGYVESFNGKLRDELLNREVYETLREAQVLTQRWRREYNQVRPHSAFAYRASGAGGGLTQEAGRESIPVEWPLDDSRTNLKIGTLHGGRSMEAHTSAVRVLRFSSDGPLPASSDADWETRVWDVETARPKVRFPRICCDIEQKSSVELGHHL